MLLALLSSLSLSASLAVQDTTPRVYPGRGAPAVEIPRLEATATVDGVLDEGAWAQAARLTDFSQFQPVDSRPAEEATEVRVWYSPDAIWFGIIAHDREPGSVHASNANRDNLNSDDRVRIYLDTFDDQRRAYFFGVNPFGVQEDGVKTEGASSPGSIMGGSEDKTPDFIWQSKGALTPQGYVVEIRVPFKSLRYNGGEPKRWGIQVVRETRRTGYQDTWTDARRANAGFLIQSGRLTGIHDIRRGVVLEAQPTLTSAWNGTRDSLGAFDRADPTSDIGLNLRLGFTSLTLDGTWNPDFSQVEADAGQVTLNQRFALFFPERRQFFLEGIELFSTPNQLVYTRTVNEPQAGVKLTGKVGGTTIAYLGALDRQEGPDALVNVARARRDFGGNSYLGLTATDRTADQRYNRVVSADVRYVFGRMYYFAPQIGLSATKDSAGAAVRTSPIWQLEVDRTGRYWGFNYKVVGIGDGFEAQDGFVNRNDDINAHVFNRFTWYGERGSFVETVSTFFGPSWIWDYAGFKLGDATEGGTSTTVTARLRGGWNVTSVFTTQFVEFDPSRYAGFTHDTGTGTIPFTPRTQYDGGRAINGTIATPTWQNVDASVTMESGRTAIFNEASDGKYWTLQGGIDLRPVPSIRLGGTLLYAKLSRVRDGSEFGRQIIPRLRLEYQPNRSLFFRFVGQYVSTRQAALEDGAGNPITGGAPAGTSNALRIDLLTSYQPNPGTVAFLGYGSGLNGTQTLTFKDLQRQQDGFFLKIAYLFRR
ncbi:MAG: carbohydrate binding family 9 domain-containing protein [Gemmatimonadetes bacterium]|nr:carbohydrate binding family 9 domain-containing protein [Gemmatimonadota bacterium]